MKPADYLRDTIDVVKQIETRFFELGKRLWRINQEKMWQGEYDSFHQFLNEIGVNHGMATMLMKNYQYYILEGKQKPKDLIEVGYSKLYAAIPLIEQDGLSDTLVRTETLSRGEIIDEIKARKYGEHVHQPKDNARYAFCECGKLIRVEDAEEKRN